MQSFKITVTVQDPRSSQPKENFRRLMNIRAANKRVAIDKAYRAARRLGYIIVGFDGLPV